MNLAIFKDIFEFFFSCQSKIEKFKYIQVHFIFPIGLDRTVHPKPQPSPYPDPQRGCNVMLGPIRDIFLIKLKPTKMWLNGLMYRKRPKR